MRICRKRDTQKAGRCYGWPFDEGRARTWTKTQSRSRSTTETETPMEEGREGMEIEVGKTHPWMVVDEWGSGRLLMKSFILQIHPFLKGGLKLAHVHSTTAYITYNNITRELVDPILILYTERTSYLSCSRFHSFVVAATSSTVSKTADFAGDDFLKSGT